ncbi:MAG: hypothetical protein ACK48P_01980 [Holosporales bacterium]
MLFFIGFIECRQSPPPPPNSPEPEDNSDDLEFLGKKFKSSDSPKIPKAQNEETPVSIYKNAIFYAVRIDNENKSTEFLKRYRHFYDAGHVDDALSCFSQAKRDFGKPQVQMFSINIPPLQYLNSTGVYFDVITYNGESSNFMNDRNFNR